MDKSSEQTGNKKENIHIPRYIKNQPWFYKDSGPSEGSDENADYLVHHRQQKKGGTLDIDNNSEPKLGSGIKDEFETVSIVYKGKRKNRLCTNCGASDHKRMECLERPRKTHKGDGNEDFSISVRKDSLGATDWDARKDRWYGYTGKEYDDLIKNWEKTKQADKLKKSDEDKQDVVWDTDEEIELTKLGLYKDSGGLLKQDTEGNAQLHRASVRLREDRAAYLNDINSSEIKYDPKSRLYKSESIGATDDKSKMFRRHLTGEALELTELNKFSREHAKKMGITDEVENETRIQHVLVANPTRYEQLIKEQKQQKVEPTNSNNATQMEAKKSKGTAQTEKTKKRLQDLYG